MAQDCYLSRNSEELEMKIVYLLPRIQMLSFSKMKLPKFKETLTCLFLSCISTISFGQDDLTQYSRYTVDDGLPSMEVYDVLQDSKGFLWFATEAGLCRYDGYEFKTFSTEDGLPTNDIINLREDKNGRIWISSVGPISFYEDGRFQIINTPDTLLSFPRFDIESTIDGSYYVTINGRIGRIDNDLNFQQLGFGDILKSTYFYKILGAFNDTVWIYNNKHFLKVYGEKIIDSIPVLYPTPMSSSFRGRMEQHSIYFTSDEGVAKYDTKKNQFQMLLPGTTGIIDLFPDQDKLWIINKDQSFTRWELSEDGQVKNHKAFFDEFQVSNFVIDREQNLWLTTYGAGVFFIPANADQIQIKRQKDGLSDNKLESILVEEDTVWVGTQLAKLNRVVGNEIQYETIQNDDRKGHNRILEIKRLQSGAFLLGTDGGVVRLKNGKQKLIGGSSVKSIYQHNDDRILIATSHSVYETTDSFLNNYQGPPLHLRSYHPAFRRILGVRTYGTLIDSNNKYWLATVGKGVITIQDDTTKYLKNRDPVFGALVTNIAELDNGIIAIATHSDGIILMKGDHYWVITTKNGLSSNICNDMATDGKNLWVATNLGLNGITDINMDSENFRLKTFNRSDGLITNEIEAVAIDGEQICLGTHLGLMIFKPSELNSFDLPPQTFITEVIINESAQEEILPNYFLEPDQKNIRIKFVGLSFSSTKNINYRYKMEGVDEDWINTKSLETHYSNLRPGTYTFSVRAIGGSGLNSIVNPQVRFFIAPTFFQTPFFKFLIYFSIVILSFLCFLLIHNYLQRRQLKELVDEKTDSLNEKVADLAEANLKLEQSNKALQQFAYIASHDLRTPLRGISGFIQLVKRKAKKRLKEEEVEYIDLAVSSVRQMDAIINDVLEMSKIGQQNLKKEVVPIDNLVKEVIHEMQETIAEKEASVEIESNMPTIFISRTNVKQLFQNLISNALKYQKEDSPQVRIDCIQENGHFKFSIEDNGIGINEKYKDKIFEMFQRLHTKDQYKGTGIGLAICKKIVEENNGQIWFESELGKGTTFYFTLPNSK